MLIQGKLLTYGDDLSKAYDIRKKVFCEEMDIPEDIIFDDMDSLSMHVIIFESARDNKAIATGRIYYDGEECVLSQIAVIKDFRRKMYGDFTVRMLLSKAFTTGIKNVYVDTLVASAVFFKTIGFQETDYKFQKADKNFVRMVISDSNVISLCSKNRK